jgi:hypothetical protein
MNGPSRSREAGMVAITFATWGVVFLDRMSLLYLAPYLASDLHLDEAQTGALAMRRNAVGAAAVHGATTI